MTATPSPTDLVADLVDRIIRGEALPYRARDLDDDTRACVRALSVSRGVNTARVWSAIRWTAERHAASRRRTQAA
jgi:hypothetical protein